MKQVPCVIALLFCVAGAGAQSHTDPSAPANLPAAMQARADSMRALNYPPATTDGVSAEELQEYTTIVETHKTRPDEPFFEYARRISPAERARLQTLFSHMSRPQQLAQHIVFRKVDPPRAAKPLTEAELAAFRDSTHYRIIVDYRPAGAAPPPPYTAADIWWYEVSPSLIKHAGSAYFTQDVRLQTLTYRDREQKRYEQYKDSYEMVLVSRNIRSERVQRPAN